MKALLTCVILSQFLFGCGDGLMPLSNKETKEAIDYCTEIGYQSTIIRRALTSRTVRVDCNWLKPLSKGEPTE